MNNFTIRDILDNTEHLALLDNQKDYRMQMATFIRMHTLRVNAIDDGEDINSLPIISMLVIAETGSGKSYVASQIAKASGVNIITVDCSTLSRAGWKGVNLGNILYKAKEKCDSQEMFETSIIHFDEFDKLRFHYGSSGSIEGNPQFNLLALFDGSIQTEGDNGGEKIDTRKMSFIFSGAFAEGDIKSIIKKRLKSSTIGFNGSNESINDEDILRSVTMKDVNKYGIMEELCGRINYICYLPSLTKEDYYTLIKGKTGSSLQKYNNLFKSIGVGVSIADSACDTIAEVSSADTLGARSINSRIYRHFQKALVDSETDPTINRVTLDTNEDGELVVTYDHGERVSVRLVPEIMLLKKADFLIPDVNFSYCIRSTQDLNKLRDFSVRLYKLTRKKNVELVSAFLDYTFFYLWKFRSENECTLEKVEYFAKGTERVRNCVGCQFDNLHEKAMNSLRWNKEDKDHLAELYGNYLDNIRRDPHKILISAIREIRRNWYAYLSRSVG